MTTTVTVEAHCNENTEVLITRSSDINEPYDEYVIQNGEYYTAYIYDSWSITVEERPK